MSHIKSLIITLIAFFLIDSIWLGYLAKGLYFEGYQNFLNIKGGELQLIWWSALLVYFLLALAIVVFVLPKAAGNLLLAFLYGALMGMIAYGVYNFTCLAIFKDWPKLLSLIDLSWGTFLCGSCSFIACYFQK